MRTKPSGRKRASQKNRPLRSREKVRAHRARLRAQGLRPVTLWVPDTRAPEFTEAARRQCLRANRSRYAAQDQAWVDAMADWSDA